MKGEETSQIQFKKRAKCSHNNEIEHYCTPAT